MSINQAESVWLLRKLSRSWRSGARLMAEGSAALKASRTEETARPGELMPVRT